MITLKQYLMGRDKDYPISERMKLNAETLLLKVNNLMKRAEIECGVRSGYRPPAINIKVPGSSTRSKHMTCDAIDLADSAHKFGSWCLDNLDILEEEGLYLESPEFTPTWCHLQTVAPKSGNRCFIP